MRDEPRSAFRTERIDVLNARADALGEYATLHGDPQLINSRIADINKIDIDEVQTAMHEWFRPEQRAALIYRQER